MFGACSALGEIVCYGAHPEGHEEAVDDEGADDDDEEYEDNFFAGFHFGYDCGKGGGDEMGVGFELDWVWVGLILGGWGLLWGGAGMFG